MHPHQDLLIQESDPTGTTTYWNEHLPDNLTRTLSEHKTRLEWGRFPQGG